MKPESRCRGITVYGKRCKLKKKCGGLCHIHKSQENCSICLNIIKNQRVLSCEHKFCKLCILKWMCTNFSCPLCRKKLIDQSIGWESVDYGLKYKMLIYITECYVKISDLPQEHRNTLANVGINEDVFMGEVEWNQLGINLNLKIIYENAIIRVNNITEWNYFKKYNKVYLFN